MAVQEVKGFVGNFHVKIKKKARYVDTTKCTGCGECTEKCPMKKIPNEFNLGLDNRRAIYIPFAQAVPKVATIDPDHCNMLKNGKCGLCAKVCSAGAIDYKQQDQIVAAAPACCNHKRPSSPHNRAHPVSSRFQALCSSRN